MLINYACPWIYRIRYLCQYLMNHLFKDIDFGQRNGWVANIDVLCEWCFYMKANFSAFFLVPCIEHTIKYLWVIDYLLLTSNLVCLVLDQLSCYWCKLNYWYGKWVLIQDVNEWMLALWSHSKHNAPIKSNDRSFFVGNYQLLQCFLCEILSRLRLPN